MLQKLIDVVKHNHAVLVAIMICVALVGWGYGCEPSTRNPRNHNEQVTRSQLNTEVKIYAEEIACAYTDLQKQEEVRAAILNAGLAYSQGQGVSIIGLISTLSGILGVGAVVDNRRKDVVIKSKTNAIVALVNGSNKESS